MQQFKLEKQHWRCPTALGNSFHHETTEEMKQNKDHETFTANNVGYVMVQIM